MPGRHLPPDPNAGDESTLGGYMAVHSRPAAFEGPDGMPYSVAIMVDETGESSRPYAGYLMFLQWRRIGEPGIDRHLETDYLVSAEDADTVRERVGALSLHKVREYLDELVNAQRSTTRRWWDAMRDDDER